jgi:predicted nucleic acid-binding protein
LTYVIDASVALKWFLTEEESQGADVLFELFLRGRIELLAPEVLLLEVANALWKQVVLLKLLRSEEAAAIFRDFITLPLNLQPSNPLASRALDLAVRFQHPVYDMLYCALAIENDCEFVTADRVLVSKLSGRLPYVRLLTTIKL